jgi:hypothetical protein
MVIGFFAERAIEGVREAAQGSSCDPTGSKGRKAGVRDKSDKSVEALRSGQSMMPLRALGQAKWRKSAVNSKVSDRESMHQNCFPIGSGAQPFGQRWGHSLSMAQAARRAKSSR